MSVLRVAREGAIARLTLSRPAAGNALDLELARALRDQAQTLRADETCAVVLIDAEGPLFCGGGDLAAMSAAPVPAEYVHELAGTVHEALLTFAQSDQVLVGAVQGTAAGGGFGIVLNCDYVVASEKATFVSAYSKVSLSPDCGTSYLLPRIAGPTRATEFVLAGRVLDAASAHDWGIVSAVVPADEVGAAASSVAEKLARVPAPARAASKRLLAAAWLPGYGEHLDRERDSIARLADSEESAALRAAFIAK
ncbi:enoyl-CoA hydratase/isomerase family protein [Agromyces aerolatus]|uniref:enoyl-CoA hydratase/isomerase family protein n=1 Tax=Agromyces sp. LY-1074 TaxID=3074080 RepID=UPI002861602A|nr:MULTISPECIES: enoyl-CoA hydratase/isomerase family protein [unclassified Agromyces]MDR5701618.1 enoyl-CoA hydratase/isomerase family protein [Agromyces sp. LY-1074]MDR5706148.1 enoyl-CoA hydratase/isomerase family protein [Agromyces sp. LY-1358]